MPDSEGRIRGIAIPNVPWHAAQEHKDLPATVATFSRVLKVRSDECHCGGAFDGHDCPSSDEAKDLSNNWFCEGESCERDCHCPKNLCDESKCEKPCKKCDRGGTKEGNDW